MSDTNTRFPTHNELSIYRKTAQKVAKLDDLVDGTALLLENLKRADEFATKMGVNRRFANPALIGDFENQAAKAKKLKAAFDAIERRELFIQFRGNDFDIVGYPTEKPETYEKYRLSGLPLILPAILGMTVVVIVAAAVVTVAAIYRSIVKSKAETEKEMRNAEKYFCSDPKSELCRQWMSKEKANFENNKSLASELFGGLSSTIGGGIGIALLVGIGIFALSKWSRKDAR